MASGSTADAFTLLERLEGKLEEYPGQLLRACVELAKMWRSDRYLKNLEALLIVADEEITLQVTGLGDVIESHDGIIGIGSGGSFALSAARALYDIPDLDARDIAERAMKVAADVDDDLSDLCIYTNHNWIFEELPNRQHVTSQLLSESSRQAVATSPTPNMPNQVLQSPPKQSFRGPTPKPDPASPEP